MAVNAQTVQNLQVQINAGNHQWLADEPPRLGGDDLGPNPYDLLLGGLAACKLITVQMYAKRKGWEIGEVNITMEHRQIKASECDDCDSEGNTKVDIIDSQISFKGDLTPEQINRLAEIADRCPVHRTMSSETKIRTVVI